MGNSFMQPLRIAIQWTYLFFTIWLGIRFYQFVSHFRSGGIEPPVPRPEGVEGFLPIAALLGLKDWFNSGSINPVHPASVVILVAVILVSLLLRRSFCSWICPIGTIEELLWKCGFSLFKKNFLVNYWLDVALRGIKYLLLAFFIFFIFIKMAPAQIATFIDSDYNKIADVRMLDFFLNLSGFSLWFIIITLLASLLVKNPFCRFLCPYGALLGLFAFFSPLKVTRNKDVCISCGVCNQFCPSRIPVMALERVHTPECIGCWRCISHCRAEGALSMALPVRKAAIPGIIFALLVILVFYGSTVIGKVTGNWKSAVTSEEYGTLIKNLPVKGEKDARPR
ncbi:MAG: 4Fe-4S binding protein [Geobacteraceae bacterium]|nr:4Fe-4S binding protein [Geobacteraceae bacterium]